MRKTILSIVALVLMMCGGVTKAQLSDSAYASVITCGAGNELYEAFGHSALRVCDPITGMDIVYNYGTFDFDTPHFYWKFAIGNLNYCLSRTTFDVFMWEYTMEGRAVWEQKLRLSHQEVNNLYLMLENNYKPEYRYYHYDLFRDNCATRVRDMLTHALNHRELSPESVTDTNKTYRDILYGCTEEKLLWWRFGIDALLGAKCDKRCTNYEYMFSPIEMMGQLDTMRVSDTGKPIAEPAEQLLAETRVPLPDSFSPTLLFWLIALVVIGVTIAGWRKGWKLAWMDRTLYIAAFAVSVLVLFLWFGSAHYCTKMNLNVLWASPLMLYFAIWHRRSAKWVIWVQVVMLLWAMLMTIAPLPQQINAAVMPICLMLAVRLINCLKWN